jgi:uncharacterized protein
MLHHQLPWYVGGPVLGLCAIAIRLLYNERLGVSGGFSDIVERVRSRSLAFGWRGWLVVGLVAGGALFALVAGGPEFHGYGWLTDTFGDAGVIVVGALLVLAGLLIGFGAQTAGGCTSGNGLSGTSMGTAASLVATMTFFATAVAVSLLIEAVI